MPERQNIHLALIFKDLAAWVKSSCVGLHVAGFSTAKVLEADGFDVTVFPVRHNVDIVESVDHYNETHAEPITHIVISAPWLSVWDLEALLINFHSTQFVVLSHSNVGFLQADPDGVYLLRQYMELSRRYPNLKVGGNSARFVDWMRDAYGYDAVLLPNLYSLENCKPDRRWDFGAPVLNIGAFGAVRPYKNLMTAAAAAVVISKQLFVPVNFHITYGGESDSTGIVSAIEQMLANTRVKLVAHRWEFWDKFVELVGSMDLLLQPSYTESFNMVTADGVFMGIPSVVSSAISWAPGQWKADSDNATEIARVGLRLLIEGTAEAGRRALRNHNESSLHYWQKFLGIPEPLPDELVSKAGREALRTWIERSTAPPKPKWYQTIWRRIRFAN